jgi:hypothetical protein
MLLAADGLSYLWAVVGRRWYGQCCVRGGSGSVSGQWWAVRQQQSGRRECQGREFLATITTMMILIKKVLSAEDLDVVRRRMSRLYLCLCWWSAGAEKLRLLLLPPNTKKFTSAVVADNT